MLTMTDYKTIFVDGVRIFYGNPLPNNKPKFYVTQDYVSNLFGVDKTYLSSSASRIGNKKGHEDWRVKIRGNLGCVLSLKLVGVIALAAQHQKMGKTASWDLTNKIWSLQESCLGRVKPLEKEEEARLDLDLINVGDSHKMMADDALGELSEEGPELPKVSSLFMVKYNRILIEKMILDNDKRLGAGAVLIWNGEDLVASWEVPSSDA